MTLIVEPDGSSSAHSRYREADKQFDEAVDAKELEKIIRTIGLDKPVNSARNYVLLNPVHPRMRGELTFLRKRGLAEKRFD